MMDITTFQQKIEEHLKLNSGLEEHRDYLGISQIGKCPRVVVREFLYGKGDLSLRSHQAAYEGYLIEADLLFRLQRIGIAVIPPSPQPLLRSASQSPAGRGSAWNEVVAPFDERLRGHVDGETVDGDLLEIKTVTVAKFENVKSTHMALNDHFAQVQLYMKYGRWKKCWIVYICRDTFEHFVVRVKYLHTQGIKYEMKAQRILAHIDSGMLPDCECRYCRD